MRSSQWHSHLSSPPLEGDGASPDPLLGGQGAGSSGGSRQRSRTSNPVSQGSRLRCLAATTALQPAHGTTGRPPSSEQHHSPPSACLPACLPAWCRGGAASAAPAPSAAASSGGRRPRRRGSSSREGTTGGMGMRWCGATPTPLQTLQTWRALSFAASPASPTWWSSRPLRSATAAHPSGPGASWRQPPVGTAAGICTLPLQSLC